VSHDRLKLSSKPEFKVSPHSVRVGHILPEIWRDGSYPSPHHKFKSITHYSPEEEKKCIHPPTEIISHHPTILQKNIKMCMLPNESIIGFCANKLSCGKTYPTLTSTTHSHSKKFPPPNRIHLAHSTILLQQIFTVRI